MAQYLLDIFYSLSNCLCCFPGSPQLRINNRSFRMLRLLGEVRQTIVFRRSPRALQWDTANGPLPSFTYQNHANSIIEKGGFSYVYLIQDANNSALYALKKIRCPFGQESVSQALKEVEAYTLFAPNPNIIQSIDYSVQTDSGSKVSGIGVADGDTAGSKTVYIVLPYYRRGNLQDAINANLVNHTRFPERRLMILMLGVCKALKAMHQYKVRNTGPGQGSGSASRAQAQAIRAEAAEEDADAAAAASKRKPPQRKKTRKMDPEQRMEADGDNTRHSDEAEQPLMSSTGGEVTQSLSGTPPGATRAYAHRDIKPGNIMIDDDGVTPILMDLGSLAPAPTPITSRSLALAVQDTAAEHSTMPYRAPELFDVKTGSVIDTKVDIWSLGCTMYACLVGKSPFEARSEETGGSLSICVLGGDWRWPGEGSANAKGKAKAAENGQATKEALWPSETVREIVSKCLAVEPSERPDVDELIGLIERCIEGLPDDDDA